MGMGKSQYGLLLAAIAIAVATTAVCSRSEPEQASQTQAPDPGAELLDARRKLDETVWRDERLAQSYEGTFVRLWDDLRNAEDKFAVLRGAEFATLTAPKRQHSTSLDGAITKTTYGPGDKQLTLKQWKSRLAELQAEGYRIVETEWHHQSFDRGHNAGPASSIAFVLHIQNGLRRLIVRGELQVVWTDRRDERGNPVPATVEVTYAQVLERSQAVPFEQALVLQAHSVPSNFLEPILVYDLDENGHSDIVLGGLNTVMWNRGDWKFEKGRLVTDLPVTTTGGRSPIKAAVIADLTGDGRPNLLAVGRQTSPTLYTLDDRNRFSLPKVVETTVLAQPSVITVGDIDGDLDLDIWLAQYKPPYVAGQMPQPYYDANDGEPSILLLNEKGEFRDATLAAGLADKRFRRTYSSSFVDLDDDGDVDLLVVSDFAGIDVYLNNGLGHFTEATADVVDEASNFGMGHTFGDYDGDGVLDFYVIGMSSTTARRLQGMGLGRPEHPKHDEMRARISHGNRMYLAQGQGKFAQPAFADQVARSGWSWGTSSFDFDSDGDLDIYVANGHISRKSAQDYCTTFWTHDIYPMDASAEELTSVFSKTIGAARTQGISWNGFEHNHLLMNDSGTGFENVAFLMGASFEFDARAVVTDDFDLDGRPDLLVVQLETTDRTQTQTLHLLKNNWKKPGRWIGARLHSQAGKPVVGAVVTLKHGDRTHIAKIVTGDSYRAQHSNQVHFGLGSTKSVDSLEVKWPDGTTTKLKRPALGRYHELSPPK